MSINNKNINMYVVIVLALLISVSCLGSYIYQNSQEGQQVTAIIYKDGKVFKQINLAQAVDEEISITDSKGHSNIVEIKGGRVHFKEANCPNKLCVSAGWLDKPGQIAVCIPNKVKVVLEAKTGEIDAVSY